MLLAGPLLIPMFPFCVMGGVVDPLGTNLVGARFSVEDTSGWGTSP